MAIHFSPFVPVQVFDNRNNKSKSICLSSLVKFSAGSEYCHSTCTDKKAKAHFFTFDVGGLYMEMFCDDFKIFFVCLCVSDIFV